MRFLIVTCTLALSSMVAVAQDSIHTPLPTRVHRAVDLAFLRTVPLGGLLPVDGRETVWSLTVANENRYLAGMTEDAETWRLAYRTRYTDKDGTEWFLEIPVLSRGPGMLDPLIDWWHASFVDEFGGSRSSVPYYRSVVRLPGTRRYGSATGLGDVTVGAGRELGFATGRVWLKLPTGDPSELLGSGNMDVALSLDKGWQTGRFAFFAHAGLVWQNQPRELPDHRPLVDRLSFHASYAPSGQTRWFLQWDHEASSTRTGQFRVDEQRRVVTFGHSWGAEGGQWTAFLTQDGDFGWIDFEGGAKIGADFTLGLQFRQRY